MYVMPTASPREVVDRGRAIIRGVWSSWPRVDVGIAGCAGFGGAKVAEGGWAAVRNGTMGWPVKRCMGDCDSLSRGGAGQSRRRACL
jgi:hypothetical protein